MIQQWVYAYSCWNRPKRAGTAAVRGFGTYSWTDGLSLEDIEELERRCGDYELPAGASSLPGVAERAALPLAAQGFRLPSGKLAIARTSYVGEGFWDHRPGAILAHAMVKESGDWEGYPAEWMDSASFWTELPKGVQEEALRHLGEPRPPSPPFLPVLREEAFGRSGTYEVGRVVDHFRGGAAREELVRLFSLWAETAHREDVVTFADEGGMAPGLIAGFTMLFPVRMAQEISWATRLASSGGRASRHDVAGADPRRARTRLEHVRPDPEAEAWVAAAVDERGKFFGFLGEFADARATDWRLLLRLWQGARAGAGAGNGMSDEELQYVARHGSDAGVRRVFERLAAGGIPGTDWRRLLDGARRTGRPAVLAAAVEFCPDEKVRDAWAHELAGGAKAAAELAAGLDAAEQPLAARHLVKSWVDDGGMPRLMEMFRNLEGRDARLAASTYLEAWRRAGGTVETAEELSWLMEKTAWVPEKVRAGYLSGVDLSLPGGRRQMERLMAALPRFASMRPAGAAPWKADVLLWATAAMRHFSKDAIARWAELAEAFGRFRPSELQEWTEVLLPEFFKGEFPADPDAGAAAHRVALRTFTAGMMPEERRDFICEYVGKVVARLDKGGRRHPAGDRLFGTLMRLALGADEEAPALRAALLAKGYPKGGLTDEEFEEERQAPSLAGLSAAEEREWSRLKTEHASAEKNAGWLSRIGRWLGGGGA